MPDAPPSSKQLPLAFADETAHELLSSPSRFGARTWLPRHLQLLAKLGDFLFLYLQARHDHTNISVQIDSVVRGIDRRATRLVFDDEAEVLRRGIGYFALVCIGREARGERVIVQPSKFGVAEIRDAILVLPARDVRNMTNQSRAFDSRGRRRSEGARCSSHRHSPAHARALIMDRLSAP